MPTSQFLWIRFAVTLVIITVLVSLTLSIVNKVVTVWRQTQTFIAFYKKSPNCVSNGDSSVIDPNLSPCVNVPITVVAKTSVTKLNHMSRNPGPITYRYINVRYSDGRTNQLEGINEDFWNEIPTGSQAFVKTWRSHVTEVRYGGASSSVSQFASTDLEQDRKRLLIWSIFSGIGLLTLQLMWRKRR